MMVNVLANRHPMIGVDLQTALEPPLATPVPKVPHLVIAPALKWGPWGRLTGKSRTDVKTDSDREIMVRGTDIGPFILHISKFHYLLPFHFLFSASKSEFGVSSVRTKTGPVAVAVGRLINLNLNCWGPELPPAPSGLVIAPNTHVAGLTLGDFIAGLFMMFLDAGIQWFLNQLFYKWKLSTKLMDQLTRKLAGWFLKKFVPKVGPVIAEFLGRGDFFETAGRAAWHSWGFGIWEHTLRRGLSQAAVDNLLPIAISQYLGSPMGFAYDRGLLGRLDQETGFTDAVHDFIANYFNKKGLDEVP